MLKKKQEDKEKRRRQKMMIYILIEFSIGEYQILDIYKPTTMISKIVPTYQLLLRRICYPQPLFFFSEENLSNPSRKMLKLQQCNNLKKMFIYLRSDTDLSKFSDREVLKKVYRWSSLSRPWENSLSSALKAKNVDVSAFDPEILGYFCGVFRVFSQNYMFPKAFETNLSEKIKQVLENPNNIKDESLIAYLDYAGQVENKDLINDICDIFIPRAARLKYESYIRLTEYFNRKKIPSKKEKQLFNEFMKTFILNVDKIYVHMLINCYRLLKPMNKSFYSCKEALEKVQNRISSVIDEIDERQFNALASFKSEANIFQRLLITKVLKEIDENGETQIDKKTLMKLFSQLNFETYHLSNEVETKLLKFLEKNLDSPYFIQKMIQKDILKWSLQKKLVEAINKSPEEIKNSYMNLKFIYDLQVRNLENNLDISDFIANLKQRLQKLDTDKTKFIYTCLVLSGKNSEKEAFLAIPEIKQQFDNIINKFIDFGHFSSFHCDIKVIDHFNRKFGQYFLKPAIDKIILDKKPIINEVIYFVMTCNKSHILRLFNEAPELIESKPLLTILKNIIIDPNESKYHFDNINIFATEYLKRNKLNFRQKKYLMNYICDIEIHHLMLDDEIISFLKLVSLFIDGPQLPDFELLKYIFTTTNMKIKNNDEYISLLIKIRENMIKIETIQSNHGYIYAGIAKELMCFGLLNKEFLTILKKNNIQFYDDQKVAYNEDFNPDNPINKSVFNLISLMRNRTINENSLKKHDQEIEQTIKTMNLFNLQSLFLNLSNTRSPYFYTVCYLVFQKITENINSVNSNFRFNQIIYKIQELSLNTQEVTKFFEKLALLISKNVNSISDSSHILLLTQLAEKNIPCSEYTSKMIFQVHRRGEKNRHGNFYNNQNLIEMAELLAYVEPRKSIILLEQELRRANTLAYKYKLLKRLKFFDLRDGPTVTKVIKIIQEFQHQVPLRQAELTWLKMNVPQIVDLQCNNIPIPIPKPREQMTWLVNNLKKFCQTHNIPFQIIEKGDQNILKINQSYLYFENSPFSERMAPVFKEHVILTFKLNNDHNLFVYCLGKKLNKKELSYCLTKQFREFKQKNTEFYQMLRQMRFYNKTTAVKSKQDPQETSEEIKDNKMEAEVQTQPITTSEATSSTETSSTTTQSTATSSTATQSTATSSTTTKPAGSNNDWQS